MTSLLIDESVAGMFRRRVAPVLEARAVMLADSAVSQLARLLGDRPRLWGLASNRPAVGSIATVHFGRRATPQIFDSSVHLPGDKKQIRGEHTVRVRARFGLTAACEPAAGAAESRGVPEFHGLLAITSREVTVIADAMPGTDCLMAVSVWANETLPLSILLKRPDKLWTVPEGGLSVLTLERDALGFAVACTNCGGNGRQKCGKCNGSGIHKPQAACDRCGGQGFRTETCRNCQGQGQRVETCNGCQGLGQFRAPCKKCGGMGMFRGGMCFSCHGSGVHSGPCRRCAGSGRKVFSCRGCNATGQRRWSCGPCQGRGYFPQQSCNACAGSGMMECQRCRSAGYLHSHFSTFDGAHSLSERDQDGNRFTRLLRPDEVCLLDWRKRQVQPVVGGAVQLIERAFEETAGSRTCDPAREARLHAHCRQFETIETCLMRGAEAGGVREMAPIRLRAAEASLSRSRDAVIYEFPIARKRPWSKDGLLPFDEGTPVRFLQNNSDGEAVPVELVYQARSGAGRPTAPPILAGCRGKGQSYRLRIRFPLEIDMQRFPGDVYVSTDEPPRPERTQIRHLRRWCGRENRDHPVLHTVAFGDRPIEALPFDPRHPRQAQALELGVSASPLGMIKGPPGTGKTTVIAEIVRALVARGQRVLVCSQTHQAVRNALERLHQLGGFRMLRYGREENLSEIEKRYVDGVADDFPERVLKRSREALERRGQRLALLTDVCRRLTAARDAAIELERSRQTADAALRESERQERAEVEAANRRFADQLGKWIQAEKTQLDPPSIRRRAVQQRIDAVRQQLGQAVKARQAAELEFTRKTGNSPHVVPVRSTWLHGVRDVLLPNWLATSGVIQDRFSRESRRANELGSAEAQLLAELAQVDAAIASIQMSRQSHEAALQAQHAETLKEIAARHAALRKLAGGPPAEAERLLRAARVDAVTAAGAIGRQLTGDSPASDWQSVLSWAETERRSADLRTGYLSRWIADIEADPRSLTSYSWESVQVFFSTCVGLASWRRLIERGRDAVDLVIIDEAAHATGPETIIPMLYSRRALLIGDEMQLPPVAPLDSEDCSGAPCSLLLRETLPAAPQPTGTSAAVRMSECWLGCSLFEWLWRSRPGLPRVMLNTQYRMHPLIADFVGSVFYPEGLSTGVRAEDRAIGFAEFTRPVCLVGTSAYGNARYEEFIDPGYRNKLEAQIVRRVLEKAEAELPEPQEFGVITPYAGQVQQILEELRDVLPGFQRVKLTSDDVASVDSFQGSERDVIVISFARSPRPCPRCDGRGKRGGKNCGDCRAKGWLGTGLTFARDLRRLNVAFSRVRKMLILIGDIDALADPRYRGGTPGGQVLQRFKEYVEDHGKVLHVWERDTGAE